MCLHNHWTVWFYTWIHEGLTFLAPGPHLKTSGNPRDAKKDHAVAVATISKCNVMIYLYLHVFTAIYTVAVASNNIHNKRIVVSENSAVCATPQNFNFWSCTSTPPVQPFRSHFASPAYNQVGEFVLQPHGPAMAHTNQYLGCCTYSDTWSAFDYSRFFGWSSRSQT